MERQIRLYHSTLYVQDESSFLPEAQQCYDAALPVARQPSLLRRLLQTGLVHVVHGRQQLGGKPAFKDEL